MNQELDLIRKLRFGSVSEQELLDIFYQYRDSYRMKLNLVMHPRFPEKYALNIISHLYAVDLIRVIKNKRTNPFIRKKAELEFREKYKRFPLGEKLSYMKIAPYSLLNYFIGERDKRVLEVMFNNTGCTEELVLKFINREAARHVVYEALSSTEWYKRPAVAEAIAHDIQAPIRMLIDILPYISKRTLRKLYEKEGTHQIVKKNIIEYFRKRRE
jgi:hypothetical protein